MANLNRADLIPLDRPAHSPTSAIPNWRLFHPDASLIIVGSRGAGKRTLGFIGATYLHRRLLIEDHYFEQVTGCNRTTFLEKYGKEAFSNQSTVVLAQVLESNRFNCVIECGTGTLCRGIQELLLQYSETNPIIYVHRDKEDLYRLLKIPVANAERLFLADQKHRDFANLEYFNLLDSSGEVGNAVEPKFRSAPITSARLLRVKEDFAKFLDLITGQGTMRSWLENPFSINAIPPEYRTTSFIMRLRLSDLLNQDFDMAELESGGDAVELIIDTWPDNILDHVAAYIAIIRRTLDLPIIYHVEENPREERQRSQDEKDEMDLRFLVHGLHLGVEYLSLDLERNENLIARVLAMRGRTKIIGSYTMKGLCAPKWSDDIYVQHFLRAQMLGCSIVRFARFCVNDRDEQLRQAFIEKIRAIPDPKPHLVAYEYSILGLLSGQADTRTPFQDTAFNPVGHTSLEQSSREPLAGPNSTRGALRFMFREGYFQPLKFYTLGSKVYYSASPALHRAAYDFLMMPHSFDARQCTSLEELDRVRSEPDFGGASLAAPFKVVMMSRVDHVSSHATAIGAINTLIPLRGKTSSILDHANARNKAGYTNKFYGDNTDWTALMTCIRRAISPRNSVQPSRTTGLVIGAGGMARAAIYALIKLGCRKIFIYNRTKANAEQVAEHFNMWAAKQRLVTQGGESTQICHVLESTNQKWPDGFQQPTMIVSCIASSNDLQAPTVEFQLPLQWLKSPTGGVVVEVAYEPLITALITQMRGIREAGGTSWVIVDGLEVVAEMAMEAFELMTGRKAPRILMRKVCNENWEKNCAPFEARR